MNWGERGEAELLAVILLFGFVAVTIGGLVVVGTAALDSTGSDAQVSRDEQAMTQFSADVHDVQSTGETRGSVEFSENADTRIDTDDFRIRVAVNGDVTEYRLGSITNTVGDERIIYEGGAVLRTSTAADRATIQSEPAIEYRDSTLQLPLYRIADESIARGNELSYHAEWADSTNEHANAVTVEVHSDQYLAWETYLEGEVDDGNVSSSASSPYTDGHVTVELETPDDEPPEREPIESTLEYALAGGGGLTVESGDIGDAIISDGDVSLSESTVEGSLDAMGRITLDEANIEGPVRGDGDIDADDGTIAGEVHARNGKIAFNEITTEGEVRGDGDIDADDSEIGGDVHSLNGGVTFDGTDAEGTVYAEDGIDVNDGSIDGELNAQNGDVDLDDTDVEAAVYAMSDVSLDGGSIGGEIHAQNGHVDINDGTVTDSIYAQSGVTLTDGVVEGEIHGQNGAVTIDGTSETGSIYTNHGGLSYDDGTVAGEIHSRGPVSLSNVTVEGDVYVGGELTCDDSTIDGEIHVYSEYNVDGCDAPISTDMNDHDGPESPEGQSGQRGQQRPDSPERMERQQVTSPSFDSNDNDRIPDDQDMIGTTGDKNKGKQKDKNKGKNKNNGSSANEEDSSQNTVVVPAGNYELDRFRVNAGETVVFDTSEGPINVTYSAATGNEEIEISDGGELIVDDGGTGNEVNFYYETNAQIPLTVDEGDMTTRPEAERGDLYSFYSTTQQRFFLDGSGSETFTGDIIAPETNHEFELTDMTIVGGVHVPDGDVTIDVDDGYAIKPPGHESSGTDGRNGSSGSNGRGGTDDAGYLVNIAEYELRGDG